VDQDPIGVSNVDCPVADDKLAGEQIVLATEGVDYADDLNGLAGAE
jgi:hypothetical protein